MHWMFQCSPTHWSWQVKGQHPIQIITHLQSRIVSLWSGQTLVHSLDEEVERGWTALHTALSTLRLPLTYVRMLRLTSLLPFNIVMPRKLKSHTSVLFLTSDGDSRELHIIYNLNTGCVLSRAFFTLFTHDCVPIHSLIPLWSCSWYQHYSSGSHISSVG